jgi:exodeoxyribonuclease VII small subunit
MLEKNVIEKGSYKQAYNELETIVNTLEMNQQPLEEAMELFSRGQALARYCMNLLDQAELKVRQLGEDTLTSEEDSDEHQ